MHALRGIQVGARASCSAGSIDNADEGNGALACAVCCMPRAAVEWRLHAERRTHPNGSNGAHTRLAAAAAA